MYFAGRRPLLVAYDLLLITSCYPLCFCDFACKLFCLPKLTASRAITPLFSRWGRGGVPVTSYQSPKERHHAIRNLSPCKRRRSLLRLPHSPRAQILLLPPHAAWPPSENAPRPGSRRRFPPPASRQDAVNDEVAWEAEKCPRNSKQLNDLRISAYGMTTLHTKPCVTR